MEKSRQNYFLIRALIVAFFVYAWLSVNIYLPALPELPGVFHTSPENLKISITLFFAGYAISQLFWGPLSERHGRRKAIIVGMLITIVGVMMAMLAENVWVFNSGRLIEALGLGCASVLGRAVLVDLLDKVQMYRTMFYATIIVNVIPAIAPIIGGALLLLFGWRSIFLLLLIYSVLLLLFFIYRFLETHPNIRKDITVKEMMVGYRMMIRRPRFLAYVMLYVLGTGGMIGYYAMAPYIFIKYLHLTPHTYGYYGLLTVASYLLGAYVSSLVTPKVGISQTILLGVVLFIVTTIIIFLVAFFAQFSIAAVIVPMMFFTFAAGTMAANNNTGALVQSAEYAGAGSALLSFGMYAGSAIFSTIGTMMPHASVLSLAVYVGCISVLASVIYFAVLFGRQPDSQSVNPA